MEKKDEGQRPVINLKNLYFFVPYEHFKMESLNSLQFLLKKGDYMTKLDLKDAYFCVPPHKESRKFVLFQWDGRLYEFLCLCFSLTPAPRTFTKLLKVPLAVEYADHNLYRWHVNNHSNQKGGGVDQGHSHLSSATFRVSSEFKEICASSMSENRISLTNSEFSTVTDTVSETEEIVSNECKIDSLSERGTVLVDIKLTTFKWDALHPESSRSEVDSADASKKKGWEVVYKGVRAGGL